MITHEIVRSFRIDAGHRVYGHEGKCASLHGHSYTFEVHARSKIGILDQLGRVIDFSVLKSEIGEFLETYWDHAMILWRDDPVSHFYEGDKRDALFAYQKHFLLENNPTAENLAAHLLTVCAAMFNHDCESPIEVFKVVCHETPSCKAVAEWSL